MNRKSVKRKENIENILKKTNKIIAFLTLIILLFTNISYANSSSLKSETRKNVTFDPPGFRYLKFKGKEIGNVLAYTMHNGKKLPAYCLNQELDGVGNVGYPNYDVIVKNKIEDKGVYRAIINGYPYKTPQQLGVANANEAFAATKEAVYTMQHGYNLNDYSAANNPGGERTLRALKQIVTAARNTSKSYVPGSVEILFESKPWQFNDKTKEIEKTGTVILSHTGETSLKLKSDIDGVKIKNMKGNEQEKFINKEQFKLTVPVKNIKKEGSITVVANATLETLPLLYAKTTVPNTQNYALTGFIKESAKEYKTNLEVEPNITELEIIKTDGEDGRPLKDVIFELGNLDTGEKLDFTTDVDGKILIKNLVPGKYYVYEKESLPGYTKYPEQIQFEIKYNEKTKIGVRNNKIKIEEKQEKYQQLEVESNKNIEKINRTYTYNNNISKINEKINNNIKLPKTGY